MRIDRSEAYRKALKVGKRIAITLLLCIPCLVLLAYYTRNVITENWAQILLFIVIMGFVVTIEELVVKRKEQKKEEEEIIKEPQEDVFK